MGMRKDEMYQQSDQPVEKGLVELTKERMSFTAHPPLLEGEASENDKN
jgi:hypothetical protein